jgi:transcription initiation factor TFIID subunit 12
VRKVRAVRSLYHHFLFNHFPFFYCVVRRTCHLALYRTTSLLNMNSNQNQGQAAGGQQPGQQQARPSVLFRPEQMRSLPDGFSAEEKQKWEGGLIHLYKQMESNPPDSKAHMDARKKIQDFSNTLRGRILARQAAQARPPNPNAAQSGQDDGTAPNQNAVQGAKPPYKLSDQMTQHINTFPYALPPHIAPGSDEGKQWLQEAKTKYARSLMAMESTQMQLKALENMVKQRNEQVNPLNENEQKEYSAKKENLQKGHADAKRYSENFRKQQEHYNELASEKAGNGSAGAVRSSMNVTQQAPNSTQPNTETVNTAIQTARNQQTQSGRANIPVNGQLAQQNEQGPPSQSMNAPSHQNNAQTAGGQATNVKVEPGANQPQVNTALANTSHMQQNLSRQQNSPHSAVPQSATSTGPPRPLSHPAALAQAARTYSSTQTSGTPNVMGGASHTHPSVPRETLNINTNKMPIPKQLPDRAIALPQPAPMQPSRPTISGGPTNAGSGLMGQPVLQKTPGFNLEGEGERVMNKRKLDELVRQVTGGGEGLDSGEGLTPEVEDVRFPFQFFFQFMFQRFLSKIPTYVSNCS